MDADRFDRFARSLTAVSSRRDVARTLTGLSLGGMLGALLDRADTEAKQKKKKGKGKKKKKRGSRSAAPAPTCTDGITNGSETGVDCGGTCPRCANGQGCTTRDDCAGALCTSGTCQVCNPVPNNCGGDADGVCFCSRPDGSEVRVCVKGDPSTDDPVPNCDSCLPDGFCYDFGGGEIYCYKPCGAA